MSLFSTKTLKSIKGKTLDRPVVESKFDYFTEALNALLENDINIDSEIAVNDDYRAVIIHSLNNTVNLLQNKLMGLVNKAEFNQQNYENLRDIIDNMSSDIVIDLPEDIYIYKPQNTLEISLPYYTNEIASKINMLKDFVYTVNRVRGNQLYNYLNDEKEPKEYDDIDIEYFREARTSLTKNDIEVLYSAQETNNKQEMITTTKFVIMSLARFSTDIASMDEINVRGIADPEIVSKINAVVACFVKGIDHLIDLTLNYLVLYHQSLISKSIETEKAMSAVLAYINGNIYNMDNDDIVRDMQYEMYLAEKELDMMSGHLDALTESVGLIYLQEANTQVITNYISKIVRGITKVWQTLQDKVSDARQNLTKKLGKQLDSVQDKLANIENPGFTINNYRNYDFIKMGNLKIQPFNYDQLQDHLDSEKDFYSSSYSQITVKEGTNFRDSVKEYLTSSTEDHRVTTKDLLDYMQYIREDFDKYRNGVKNDIKVINDANDSIIATAKSVNKTDSQTTNQNPSKVDTTPGNASPVAKTNEAALLEADDNKNSTKVTFTDDPNREVRNNGASYDKKVSVYMGVSTQIISAKMQILRERYMLCVNTIIHAMLPPKKPKAQK